MRHLREGSEAKEEVVMDVLANGLNSRTRTSAHATITAVHQASHKFC